MQLVVTDESESAGYSGGCVDSGGEDACCAGDEMSDCAATRPMAVLRRRVEVVRCILD